MIQTFSFFVVAGLFEVGGVYLVWLWIREGKPIYLGLLGLVSLFIYSLIQTRQAFNFGRAFAAYGGVFIILSMLWGWVIDGKTPDRWDWIGISICLIGAILILWAPRK